MEEKQMQAVMDMARELVQLRTQVKAMEQVMAMQKEHLEKAEDIRWGLFWATRELEMKYLLAQRDHQLTANVLREAFNANMKIISEAGETDTYNLWKGNFDEIIKSK